MTLADAIPSAIIHINEHTVADEANAPVGGVAACGYRIPVRWRSGEHGSLHRHSVAHRSRGDPFLPPLGGADDDKSPGHLDTRAPED
jgi:hypothetical protein